MSRLIDGDKLLIELMDSDLDHLQRDDWKEVIQIVQDAPTIQTYWTPVTERLPEKNGRYWVWADKEYTPDHVDEPCSYKGSTEASFINGRWFGSHIGKNVYAWMPLPAPYKEGEK